MSETNQLDLFEVLARELEPWAAERGGLFSRARDAFEVIELLGEAPGRFRVILGWEGEETVGDHRSGIALQKFRVVVSQNRGLAMMKGANLSVGRDGAPPLMKRANELRDKVRGLDAGEQTSRLFVYTGTEPVRVDVEGKTYQLDAYELRIQITAALPARGG